MVIFTPLNYSAHINNGRAAVDESGCFRSDELPERQDKSGFKAHFKAVFSSK